MQVDYKWTISEDQLQIQMNIYEIVLGMESLV